MDQLYLNFSLQTSSDMWFVNVLLHPLCRAHTGGKDCLPCSHCPVSHLEQPLNCRSKREPSCASWAGSAQPSLPRSAVPRLMSRQGTQGRAGQGTQAGQCLQRTTFTNHQPEPPAHLNIFTKGAILPITHDFSCKDDYCSLSAKTISFLEAITIRD